MSFKTRAHFKSQNERFFTNSQIAVAALLFSYIVIFVIRTLRWPLVNDAALMHYVCFLISHGSVPYRDIGDINMPGAYAIEWIVIRSLGPGDLAWRLFDFFLMAAAGCAMTAIAGMRRWFAGVFAASLFALLHGRDGVGQAGQRDLSVTVFVLWAYAFLFFAHRRGARAWLILSGLCIGCATTIKPPAVFFCVLLFAGTFAQTRSIKCPPPLPGENKRLASTAFLAVGMAMPLLAVCVFLARQHSWTAFAATLHGNLAYHTSLGRRSLAYLFIWCAPVALKLLAVVAGLLCLQSKRWKNPETLMLLSSVLIGLMFYLVQGKGFAYQRYPLVAFLLLWVALELNAALRRTGTARAAAAVGLAFGLVLASLYLASACKTRWQMSFSSTLEEDLTKLGGDSLSGRVQCMDSISGCIPVLYHMRLVQSTGALYDEFFFSVRASTFVQANDARLLAQLRDNPPKVIIVSRWLFPDGPDEYKKLTLWPAFQAYLSSGYRLYADREFPVAETGPEGYRLFVRVQE